MYRNAIDHILVLNENVEMGMSHLGIIDCGVCLESSCNTDAYTDHRRMQIILELPLALSRPSQVPIPSRLKKMPQINFSVLRQEPELQRKLQDGIDSKYKENVDSLASELLGVPSIEEANGALDNAIREACIEILPKLKKLPKTITWYQKNKNIMDSLIKLKRSTWSKYYKKRAAVESGMNARGLQGLLTNAKQTSERVKTEGLRLRNEFLTIAEDMDHLFLKNAWGPLTQLTKAVFGQGEEAYSESNI